MNRSRVRPPLHKLCASTSTESDLYPLDSLRIVPETCCSRRRNRHCVYFHLKPDRPFLTLILRLPVRHIVQLEVLDTAGTEQFTALNEFYIKVRRHHKFLLPKPCPTQLRPLARSPSHQLLITVFSLSDRLVAALSLSSGPYLPIPSPRPCRHARTPGSDTFVQQPNTARWSARSTEPPRANLSCQGHHGTFSGPVFHIRLPSVILRIRVLMQRGMSDLLPP